MVCTAPQCHYRAWVLWSRNPHLSHYAKPSPGSSGTVPPLKHSVMMERSIMGLSRLSGLEQTFSFDPDHYCRCQRDRFWSKVERWTQSGSNCTMVWFVHSVKCFLDGSGLLKITAGYCHQ